MAVADSAYAGDASCPAWRLDSTEFLMMIFNLFRDGVLAPAAALASSTCSTRATSSTSLRTSSTAACAFAAHVWAVLSRFAMHMSLASRVMGIGAALAPLRSACACHVHLLRLPLHSPWLLAARDVSMF